MNLTPRQEAILEMIRTRIEQNDLPPTRAEIAREFGFRSANASEQHLRALARKGVIELLPGASRGIRLTDGRLTDGRSVGGEGIPVVGRVAAGSPILAAEHIEGHVRLDTGLFKPRADYLLKVQGMSMRGAGILDGDMVAVHSTPEARNGQIVVARVDGEEVTVKRYRRHADAVELIPENPEFKAMRLDPARRELEIEGVVVGVIRDGTALP